MDDHSITTIDELTARLGARARRDGFTVAIAESLTGGMLSSSIAAAEAASEWFRGGVVAYASEVKFEVLGVRPGPVVTEETARQMAHGAARLLRADVAVAVTGVAGPAPEEGHGPGTVWFAAHDSNRSLTRLAEFDGDPATVCLETCRVALELALELTDPTDV